LVWQHFKIFFGIPKIVLTIAMMLVLYSILKVSTYSEWIVISLYFILIGFTFYKLFKNNRISKRKKQTQQKRWLFEEIINQYGGFFLGVIIFQFNIFVQIFNHSNKYLSNDYYMMGLSFFSVVVILVLFIIFKIIPAKAEEYLQSTYPEYKLQNL
jgi:magnesium-transporting ATPase (P-type)